MTENTFIKTKELTFSYNGVTNALSDVTLEAKEGEAIGIIGANGAGKSTLLKLLVGIELGFTGEIDVCGNILDKGNLRSVRERIGYVFQDSDSQLFMTRVEDDIAFAPRNHGLPKDEIDRRVDDAMRAVNITHLKGRDIHQLSGGEKKLASIATVLSMKPDILLMDEPSIELDPKNRRNLINVVNSLSGLKLIASHDLDFIMDTCERVILLSHGRIVRDAPANAVLTDKDLLEENGMELPLSMSRM